MAQVRDKGWSHRQIRALQKASDMSPYIISSAKQSSNTHHCHKGLGSCIQVLASRLHHLSWFQDAWPGQRHASKQRASIYSMVQVPSSRGNRLWWHVDVTWLQSHATELTDISPKDEKYQQNLWRSNSNHPKANQSQNTSHSIVAGAHRKQWGHILEDQQRRNVGKLHGAVRKGPHPHLATWKPEPGGYPTFDHGTYELCSKTSVVAFYWLVENRIPGSWIVIIPYILVTVVSSPN